VTLKFIWSMRNRRLRPLAAAIQRKPVYLLK